MQSCVARHLRLLHVPAGHLDGLAARRGRRGPDHRGPRPRQPAPRLPARPDAVRSILERTATDHACPAGGVEDYTDEGRPADWNAVCEGTDRGQRAVRRGHRERHRRRPPAGALTAARSRGRGGGDATSPAAPRLTAWSAATSMRSCGHSRAEAKAAWRGEHDVGGREGLPGVAGDAGAQHPAAGAGGERAPQPLHGPHGAVLGRVLEHEAVGAVGSRAATSDVRSVARIMAVTTRGSDGTAGPSGRPSTTSSWAKASGRSTRRQAMTRQLSAARKNGWANRPDDGVEQGRIDVQRAVGRRFVLSPFRHGREVTRPQPRRATARSTISPMIFVSSKSFGV